MTKKKQELTCFIIYQPQKYRIKDISGKVGEDVDGDLYRPIHHIKDLSESQVNLWIKKNKSKCLVIIAKRGDCDLYNWAINEISGELFNAWMKSLSSGTAPTGPSMLIDPNLPIKKK